MISRILSMAVSALVLLSGCAETGSPAGRYASDSLWLCRPGLAHNYCFDNMDATEIHADGTQSLVPFPPATDTDFDCFYIYPTVDLTGPIGNHTDFSDVSTMLVPLRMQAAPFQTICTVYAPLYRQMTISTLPIPDRDKYTEVAYSDVEEAFNEYLRTYNKGRPFVLMGHSQGAMMIRMLLQRKFDGDPAMRKKLIAALPIGGDIFVPDGQKAGDTFASIPLCSSEAETGCAIAFHSYDSGGPPTGGWNTPPPAGTDTACVNPANAGGGLAYFQGSYFPGTVDYSGMTYTLAAGLPTPYFIYNQFYTGECKKDAQGKSYLEVAAAPITGDTRVSMDFSLVPAAFLLGLHVLDYNFPMGDLLRIVRAKADAFPPP